MTEFLEATHEKFIFRVKVGYLYSELGFWVDIKNNVATMGLSDFLQKSRGDVAFVETVAPASPVKVGQELGTIETIKATFAIVSPVYGKVVEVNPELETNPQIINSDPYGAGWIYKFELTHPEEARSALLQAESYLVLMRAKIEEEGKRLHGK